MPGYLSTTENEFQNDFANPIEKHGDSATLDRFHRVTKPFLLRRLKSDKNVIADLPEKVYINETCELTAEQVKLYEELASRELTALSREELRDQRQSVMSGGGNKKAKNELKKEFNKGRNKTQMFIFALFTKLKQICDHPAVYLKSKEKLRLEAEEKAKLEGASGGGGGEAGAGGAGGGSGFGGGAGNSFGSSSSSTNVGALTNSADGADQAIVLTDNDSAASSPATGKRNGAKAKAKSKAKSRGASKNTVGSKNTATSKNTFLSDSPGSSIYMIDESPSPKSKGKKKGRKGKKKKKIIHPFSPDPKRSGKTQVLLGILETAFASRLKSLLMSEMIWKCKY
jgi:SNF2 family DNA or RNA helicase